MTVAGVVVAYAGPVRPTRHADDRLESHTSAPNVGREVLDRACSPLHARHQQWTPLVPGTKMVSTGRWSTRPAPRCPPDGLRRHGRDQGDRQRPLGRRLRPGLPERGPPGGGAGFRGPGRRRQRLEHRSSTRRSTRTGSSPARRARGCPARPTPRPGCSCGRSPPGTESYLRGTRPRSSSSTRRRSRSWASRSARRWLLQRRAGGRRVESLDPLSGHQLKCYAKGMGDVRIAPVSSDARETLSLSSISQLTGPKLAKARAAAKALDHHAYSVVPTSTAAPSGDRPGRAHHDVAAGHTPQARPRSSRFP